MTYEQFVQAVTDEYFFLTNTALRTSRAVGEVIDECWENGELVAPTVKTLVRFLSD
jgi:hypothetical protein